LECIYLNKKVKNIMYLLTNVTISKKSIVCALVAGQAICSYFALDPADDLLVRLALPGTMVVCETIKQLINKAKGNATEQNQTGFKLSMSDLEVAGSLALGALAASQLSDSPSRSLLMTTAATGTWLTMQSLYNLSCNARRVAQNAAHTIDNAISSTKESLNFRRS